MTLGRTNVVVQLNESRSRGSLPNRGRIASTLLIKEADKRHVDMRHARQRVQPIVRLPGGGVIFGLQHQGQAVAARFTTRKTCVSLHSAHDFGAALYRALNRHD
jgi:hypothetical protein